jgi:hypothetical protein
MAYSDLPNMYLLQYISRQQKQQQQQLFYLLA